MMQQDDPRPLVLLIAGVDSGGGAGITADAVTVHECGGWALPCVSALTAQSLTKVAMVEPASPEMFATALRLSVEDWPGLAAVKIGVITSQKLLDLTLDFLEEYAGSIPVVWDPVLNATAGRLDSADLASALDRILKVTTLFTPNLPEALELAGWDQERFEHRGPQALGREFLARGARAVLLKGGHQNEADDAVDYLVSPDLCCAVRSPRLAGEGAHGGGCALSSSLATFMARGYALADAVVLAKDYVYRGILHPGRPDNARRPPIGHNGMITTINCLPVVSEDGFPASGGPFPICPMDMGLYPVVSSAAWVRRVLEAGARTVQLRIKNLKDGDPALKVEADAAVAAAKLYGARLFIDDHVQCAIQSGAYGVHLGMEDLRHADLAAIRKAGLRLGVSTHGFCELCRVLPLEPSYIALGHVFPTQTKKMPSKPQGLENLRIQARILRKAGIPTVAIGGIKLDNAAAVRDCGVGSIAVVTGITAADNPEDAVAGYLRVIGSGPDERDAGGSGSRGEPAHAD